MEKEKSEETLIELDGFFKEVDDYLREIFFEKMEDK